VAAARLQTLTSGFLPTDIGFFPRAKEHLRARSVGVEEAIFIFCIQGFGWCEIAGHNHPVGAGDLLVVPPEVPHIYGARGGEPWTIFWFHAQGALIQAYLYELGVSSERPVIHIGEEFRVRALFEEALEIIEHGYTKLLLFCASQTLTHLITVLIREHRRASHKQPSVRQQIAQTIAYMRQHLNQSLRLDALAAIANLSRSHYVELFKQQSGYAPIDYFIRLRMQRACRLLDMTEMSVKAIASELGYEDPLYFSRLFRKVNEISPIEYRRRHKG
jgi:AraC-like DNA-binding protein